MDISAPAVSLADRPRTGHLGHQGSQAPGRPVLHLVSSSRRPRQENGDYVIASGRACDDKEYIVIMRVLRYDRVAFGIFNQLASIGKRLGYGYVATN